MHYGMDGANRYRRCTPGPSPEDCRKIFAGIGADIILYGHDHKTAVNQDERNLYINCGSLGCPARDGNIARAGILTFNNGQAAFEQINVPYDVDKVVADITRLAYPASEEIKMFFYGIR